MSMYDNNGPHSINVAAGDTVYLCQCGMTKTAPYCDGSHNDSDSGVGPVAYTADSDGPIYVCGCGKSGNMPMCDGSHNG